VDEEEAVAALCWGRVRADTGEVWHSVGAGVPGLFGFGSGVLPWLGGAGVTGGVAAAPLELEEFAVEAPSKGGAVGDCPAEPPLVVDGAVLGNRLSAAAAPACVP
jgi:hypothetical protein